MYVEAHQSTWGSSQDVRIVSLRLQTPGRGKARRSTWHIEAAQSSRGSAKDARVEGSGTDVAENDFVAQVLRSNPSQVEDRYRIGDGFYTLKEKQNLEASFVQKIARAVSRQFGALREKLEEGKEEGLQNDEVIGGQGDQRGIEQYDVANPGTVRQPEKAGKPVYISELLREYKGNLYVPEEAFMKPVSELEEFNWNLENLPEMSVDQFLKAVKANQVKLLTSRGISTLGGSFAHWDFVVELNPIPGESSLQRRKWSESSSVTAC